MGNAAVANMIYHLMLMVEREVLTYLLRMDQEQWLKKSTSSHLVSIESIMMKLTTCTGLMVVFLELKSEITKSSYLFSLRSSMIEMLVLA